MASGLMMASVRSTVTAGASGNSGTSWTSIFTVYRPRVAITTAKCNDVTEKPFGDVSSTTSAYVLRKLLRTLPGGTHSRVFSLFLCCCVPCVHLARVCVSTVLAQRSKPAIHRPSLPDQRRLQKREREREAESERLKNHLYTRARCTTTA